MPLNHTVDLVVGDPGGDGHGHEEHFPILCNLSPKELERAYKKGTKQVSFNLTVDICCDFDDSEMEVEKIQELIALGYHHKFHTRGDEDEYSSWITTDDFMKMYLFICQLGDPDLDWKETTSESIRIGGYGLFNN